MPHHARAEAIGVQAGQHVAERLRPQQRIFGHRLPVPAPHPGALRRQRDHAAVAVAPGGKQRHGLLFGVGDREVHIGLGFAGGKHVAVNRRHGFRQAGKELGVAFHPKRHGRALLDRFSGQQQRLLGQDARQRLEVLGGMEGALADAGDFLKPGAVGAFADRHRGNRDALFGDRLQDARKIAGLR